MIPASTIVFSKFRQPFVHDLDNDDDDDDDDGDNDDDDNDYDVKDDSRPSYRDARMK